MPVPQPAIHIQLYSIRLVAHCLRRLEELLAGNSNVLLLRREHLGESQMLRLALPPVLSDERELPRSGELFRRWRITERLLQRSDDIGR